MGATTGPLPLAAEGVDLAKWLTAQGRHLLLLKTEVSAYGPVSTFAADARLDLAATPFACAAIPQRPPASRHEASTMLAPASSEIGMGTRMDPQLTLTVHSDRHSVILTVGGEVDLATAPQLRAKLMGLVENGTDSIIVDLTPLGFIDSTGMSVLLAAHRRADERGRSMRLVCPESHVLRALQLTGVARVVPVSSSLVEAPGTQPAGADTV